MVNIWKLRKFNLPEVTHIYWNNHYSANLNDVGIFKKNHFLIKFIFRIFTLIFFFFMYKWNWIHCNWYVLVQIIKIVKSCIVWFWSENWESPVQIEWDDEDSAPKIRHTSFCQGSPTRNKYFTTFLFWSKCAHLPSVQTFSYVNCYFSQAVTLINQVPQVERTWQVSSELL